MIQRNQLYSSANSIIHAIDSLNQYFFDSSKMVKKSYSLKDDKYANYLANINNNELITLSKYCDCLQFLYKYKLLLELKIEQNQKIKDNKEEMKENDELYEQMENEKFVLRIELDKITRGKWKNYVKAINNGKRPSVENKLNITNQLIEYIKDILNKKLYDYTAMKSIDKIFEQLFVEPPKKEESEESEEEKSQKKASKKEESEESKPKRKAKKTEESEEEKPKSKKSKKVIDVIDLSEESEEPKPKKGRK